jgi:hypothetical protein
VAEAWEEEKRSLMPLPNHAWHCYLLLICVKESDLLMRTYLRRLRLPIVAGNFQRFSQ